MSLFEKLYLLAMGVAFSVILDERENESYEAIVEAAESRTALC